MVPASGGPSGSRRADAQRNRQRLIEVALAAFSSTDGDVPLERIAKDAGVGIGTLYRHFPSREALIEAVYRSELEQLCAEAPGLLETRAPDAALRIWMGRYLDFVATKRGMADALRTVIASGAINSADTRTHLSDAIGAFLAGGPLRDDIRPEDVSASLAGVMLAATDRDQAERLLDLLVDGLRA